MQRIISTNERKLQKTLAKEKSDKAIYQFDIEQLTVNNMVGGENMKIQSRSVLELKSFDNSRLSLGPETAYRRPSNEGVALGDYFSSKKDLKNWRLQNDEVLDNLTPTIPKLSSSITPTKGGKPMSKVVK